MYGLGSNSFLSIFIIGAGIFGVLGKDMLSIKYFESSIKFIKSWIFDAVNGSCLYIQVYSVIPNAQISEEMPGNVESDYKILFTDSGDINCDVP